MDTPQIENDDSNNKKKPSGEINEKDREAILKEIHQKEDEIKKISDEMSKFRKENCTCDYCTHFHQEQEHEHTHKHKKENQEQNNG